MADGNSSGLGFALDGDFNERIDSGRAVLAGELLDFDVFCPFSFAGHRDCPIAPWKNRRVLSGSLNLLPTCSQVQCASYGARRLDQLMFPGVLVFPFPCAAGDSLCRERDRVAVGLCYHS
jgi:hypothetical protein